MASFSTLLHNWYRQHRRDLPWRGLSDPYPVWLSEVILQQTRVDQGMGYYFRFLGLFPDVHALAAASEDEVLHAWQGLGYYSRARNLHAAARIVSGEMNGIFPKTAAGLEKLPGIGPYTAAAIASFCFGECIPVLDGNVIRVLARIAGIYEAIDVKAGKAALSAAAISRIDRSNPGDYNQAIMEFGALHCTPFKPLCSGCPFVAECIAFRNGDIAVLPVKSRKAVVKDTWMYYFFLRHEDKIYLRRRNGKGIWQGLHDFPSVESDLALDPAVVTHAFGLDHNLGLQVITTGPEMIHILTHRRIHAVFISSELTRTWDSPPEDVFVVAEKEIASYGVSRLIEKFLQEGRPV